MKSEFIPLDLFITPIWYVIQYCMSSLDLKHCWIINVTCAEFKLPVKNEQFCSHSFYCTLSSQSRWRIYLYFFMFHVMLSLSTANQTNWEWNENIYLKMLYILYYIHIIQYTLTSMSCILYGVIFSNFHAKKDHRTEILMSRKVNTENLDLNLQEKQKT